MKKFLDKLDVIIFNKKIDMSDGNRDKKRYYAVWFISEKGRRVKKIGFSDRTLKVVIGIFSIIMVGTFTFTILFFVNVGKIKGYSDAIKKEMEYRNLIKKLLTNIEDAYKYLSELKEFEKKVRITANIDPYGKEKEEIAIGTGGLSMWGGDESVVEVKDLLALKLQSEVGVLRDMIREESKSFKHLLKKIEEKKEYMRCLPLLWPVRGWVTSEFGYRYSPVKKEYAFHQGIDIATRVGTPVVAPADGTVIFAGWESGYGRLIIIDHGYGIITRYAHLSKFYVEAGNRVKRGEVIGAVGNTGMTTGPHLHYEVIVRGVPVNPRDYMID